MYCTFFSGKKFHCGADVKDHIIDMETRRLSRNKHNTNSSSNKTLANGSSSSNQISAKKKSQSKKAGGRVYHNAVIEPDSRHNITQKMPPKIALNVSWRSLLGHIGCKILTKLSSGFYVSMNGVFLV